MKKICWFAAVTGLILGFVIHIMSLSGIYAGEFFPVWFLHIGIFVVWIPAIIELKKKPQLSEVEYLKLRANEVRGFSGHWMVFYSLSMGILWPKDRVPDNNNSMQKQA